MSNTTTSGNSGATAPKFEQRAYREIVTPEGVRLPVTLAGRSDRAAAVLIDIGLMVAVLTLLVFAVDSSLPGSMQEHYWAIAVFSLLIFATRSFYFIIFELRWQGTTPGKRALGIRVVDRAGGRLRTDAVFARNLTREVELFLPITLLFATAASWVFIPAFLWTCVFLFMPLFNKDRSRVGDMVAGTWVVEAPKSVLLPDLAETPRLSADADSVAPPKYRFSAEQLGIYGIYELQTLEKLLRQQDLSTSDTLAAASEQIRRKIDWSSEDTVDTREFLEAFYAALRAHLEGRMLLGVRRESKHDDK